MKNLVTTALLALAATAGAAWAQVYGTNDDPYAQNPFASNMNLPDAAPAAPATAAPASTTPARSSSDSVTSQDSAKTQQTAASAGSSSNSATNAPMQKPAQP